MKNGIEEDRPKKDRDEIREKATNIDIRQEAKVVFRILWLNRLSESLSGLFLLKKTVWLKEANKMLGCGCVENNVLSFEEVNWTRYEGQQGMYVLYTFVIHEVIVLAAMYLWYEIKNKN